MLLVLAGAALAVALRLRETPSEGHLVTSTTLPVVTTDKAPPKVVHKPKPKPIALVDRPCWDSFGGGPRRTLARGRSSSGRPAKSVWARGLHDLMEYPPTYCDGRLFVNLERGNTVAIDAANGQDPLAAEGAGPDRVVAGARRRPADRLARTAARSRRCASANGRRSGS